MNAVMIFGAWLGGTHPNRDLLWSSIVDQIQDLFKSGMRITMDSGESIQVFVRAQFVTFDLPALAQTCNVTQFNGYDACPDCLAHGTPIERQIFYPYSATPYPPKTDDDYRTLAARNSVGVTTKGIKGPTPLNKILLLPVQIAKDYMHLVCSGHTKTLLSYWKNILLPGVFDEGSAYVPSIVLPHCFGYQFTPVSQCSQWKTKMFR